MNRLKTPLTFIALYALLLLTACPSQAGIQKAASASATLAGITLDAVRTTKTAYESGLLTVEQKDKIAAKLLILAKGGAEFNSAVRKASVDFGGKLPPPAVLDILNKLFDDSVITPFLEILTDLHIIKNAPAVTAAIEAIRATILTISQTFTQKTAQFAIVQKEITV